MTFFSAACIFLLAMSAVLILREREKKRNGKKVRFLDIGAAALGMAFVILVIISIITY